MVRSKNLDLAPGFSQIIIQKSISRDSSSNSVHKATGMCSLTAYVARSSKLGFQVFRDESSFSTFEWKNIPASFEL